MLERLVEHSLDLRRDLMVDERLLQLGKHVFERGHLCESVLAATDPTDHEFIGSGCQ